MWDAIIITPFMNVLLFIYSLVWQNFGIAIILFTILIRLITHPLMVQQIKGTQGMQNLQKNEKWIEIQAKYKNDKEKLAQEQMALYKELGINPFGSCLPMLIQFPIIIGLYQVVIQAMANTPLDMLKLVRHAYPWLQEMNILNINTLIPLNNQFLWMNLGQPERLYLPFLNFGIPILAILVVITTYMQSKLMTPPSATPNDQTSQMTGMMNLYMPIFMGWLAWTLASGLSLYFVVSNVFSILQYAAMGKANWKSLMPGYKPKPVALPDAKTNRGKNESRKNNARSNRANS
ncbi:MAG: YidC/Oxa1 family membrane protein insertase [Chloroflexi bacterium]|nr:MAG: YidC/Oxa1 family membrane protein insertase [Chloroflexota bacterium]